MMNKTSAWEAYSSQLDHSSRESFREIFEAGWVAAIEAAALLADDRAHTSASNAEFATLNRDRQELIDRFDLKAADFMKLATKIRDLKSDE